MGVQKFLMGDALNRSTLHHVYLTLINAAAREVYKMDATLLPERKDMHLEKCIVSFRKYS